MACKQFIQLVSPQWFGIGSLAMIISFPPVSSQSFQSSRPAGSLDVASVQATDPDRVIFVGTILSGYPGLLEHHPAHSELPPQSLEVRAVEILPSPLRFYLLPPFLAQRRKHGHRAAVFDGIGQHAAPRDAAEAVAVLIGDMHGPWIHGKDAIHRGMVARPHKGLHPL